MKLKVKSLIQQDVVIAIICAAVLVASLFIVTPVAAVLSMTAGNTLTYELTKVDVPFDQLSNDSNLAALQGLSSTELVGSKLVVKILRVDSVQGWYTIGYAGILGQKTTFDFQILPNLDSNSFPFGLNLSALTLESGAGLSFTGDEIRMWNFFDFSSGKSGLFYLDSSRWNDHEAALKAEFGSNVTVTNGETEFIVVLQEDVNRTELSWFKKGENAGLLKSFELQAVLLLDNGTTTVATVAFSFVSKSVAILPDVNTVAFELTNGDFDSTVSGDFQKDWGDLLSLAKTFVTNWEGKEPFKYEIGNKHGVFYYSDVFVPLKVDDPSSGIFKAMTLAYNGFDGRPYIWDQNEDLFRPATTGGIELIPGMLLTFPAPVVTPDWEVREGSNKLARSVLDSFAGIVTKASGDLAFIGLPGVIVSQFEQDVEFTNSTGLKNSIVKVILAFSVNGTEFYPGTTNGTLEGDGTLDVSLDLSVVQAFNNDGILALVSVNVSLFINANTFGYFNTTSADFSVTSGLLDLNSNMTFKNTNFEQLIKPSSGESSSALSSNQFGATTPGFEQIVLFLAISSSVAYLMMRQWKKRKTK